MKKQDFATIIGIIAGIAVIMWGILKNTPLSVFYDTASFIITVLGSMMALLVNFPLSEIKRLIPVMAQSFKELKMSNFETIQLFTSLSKKARREGLLSLEDEVNNIGDDYLKKGLQMVIDGIEPETIREIMELEIGEMERRHKAGQDMLKSWAAYAPAFGMIGTLIGLIQMLVNLTDSSSIASGMAVALITTFYGSVIANLIFTPMAAKLAARTDKEAGIREMMLEGILAIQSGVNPRIVEEKLLCYLSPKDRIKYAAQNGEALEGVQQNG
ncbi:motility protein A [Clostridium thermarum]|uniref:motility protein A n=1 Tax=Clostridium thermarum TaxID=1716543 RepID=UPI0013D0EF12|nr:MotA/TolQ/ExbB proton channel family protein [Clostridium thermarum]